MFNTFRKVFNFILCKLFTQTPSDVVLYWGARVVADVAAVDVDDGFDG